MAKPELRDHRKFLKLRRLLGEPTPHVMGYLECLWLRGYQTGSAYIGDALDVEAAAEYPGAEGRFTDAAHRAGFIDQDGEGNFSIHDLFDHAPRYAQKRMVRRGNASFDCNNDVHADTNRPESGPRGHENTGKVSTWPTETRTKNLEPKTKNPKPKSKRSKSSPQAAAVVAAVEPEPAPADRSDTPRPRDELFDAIADVTGSDPKASGSHIGRVKKLLGSADPPYTPAEVRRFADPDFLARELPWIKGQRPSLGLLEQYIGRVRNPSPGGASHENKQPGAVGRAGRADARPGKYDDLDAAGSTLFGGSPGADARGPDGDSP